jgi:hypothetical protein
MSTTPIKRKISSKEKSCEKSSEKSTEKNKFSQVWGHFEEDPKVEGSFICLICRESFISRGGTTNLWHHLKAKHTNVWVEHSKEIGKQQRTLDNFLGLPVPPNGFTMDEIRLSLTKFILTKNLSPEVVENQHFKVFFFLFIFLKIFFILGIIIEVLKCCRRC